MKTPTTDYQERVVEFLVELGNDEHVARQAVVTAWEEGWGRVEASPAGLAEAIAADYVLWSGQ